MDVTEIEGEMRSNFPIIPLARLVLPAAILSWTALAHQEPASTRAVATAVTRVIATADGQAFVPAGTTSLKGLEKKYRLRIVFENSPYPVKTSHGIIDGETAGADEIGLYAPVLAFEWNLYPVKLVKKTGLKRIVLCKNLSFASQRRSAVPVFENATLYLDVARAVYDVTYLRKVIHHEFYHIIDLRDDGKLYRDKAWTELNPKGFKYGSGGKNAQEDPTMSIGSDKVAGFLNKYSATGVEEDKAELFSHMMVQPKVVEQRAAKDPVLRAKVARMKELMRTFCPEMNEKYWERIKQARRPAPQEERRGNGKHQEKPDKN